MKSREAEAEQKKEDSPRRTCGTRLNLDLFFLTPQTSTRNIIFLSRLIGTVLKEDEHTLLTEGVQIQGDEWKQQKSGHHPAGGCSQR